MTLCWRRHLATFLENPLFSKILWPRFFVSKPDQQTWRVTVKRLSIKNKQTQRGFSSVALCAFCLTSLSFTPQSPLSTHSPFPSWLPLSPRCVLWFGSPTSVSFYASNCWDSCSSGWCPQSGFVVFCLLFFQILSHAEEIFDVGFGGTGLQSLFLFEKQGNVLMLQHILS